MKQVLQEGDSNGTMKERAAPSTKRKSAKIDDPDCPNLAPQQPEKQEAADHEHAAGAGSRPRSSSSRLRDAGLFLNCFVTVPMWSMLIWIAVYIGLCVSCWPYPWARYGLLLYLLYILLDCGRSTTSSSDNVWLSYEQTERLRCFPGFGWVAEYFPVSLVKTTDLDPSCSYIFLYQPHGIIGMGCNAALNTNGCQFHRKFPGIRRWGVTLNAVFWVPFFREWLAALGFVGADKAVLRSKLVKSSSRTRTAGGGGGGSSIVLVPGGAAEALHAAPGTFKLIRRQGFLRLARETGARPVPCLGFGENRAFSTMHFAPDSAAFRWQQRLAKCLSFSTPIVVSPFCVRHPIHVVVGEPVRFPEGASLEDCQKQYMAAVEKLYHAHKDKYGHSDIPLEWL